MSADLALTVQHATGGPSGVEGLGDLHPTTCPRFVMTDIEFERFERWAKQVLGVAVKRVLRRDEPGHVVVYGTRFMVDLVRSLGVFPQAVRVIGGAA